MSFIIIEHKFEINKKFVGWFMKVVMICDYLSEGHGIYTHVHYLSKELRKKKCIDELSIVTIGNYQPRYNNIITVDHNNKPFSIFFSDPRKIMESVEKLNPDIIHVHGTYPPYSIIPVIAKNYPTVVTLHGTVSMETKFSAKSKLLLQNIIYGNLEKRAINRASRIIAVSPPIKEFCLKMGADPSKVDLIPNGIALDEYEFESNNQIHPSLLYIGRLVKIKGIDILIKSLPLIKVSYPSIKLFIAGTGGQSKKIKLLVEKMGLTENVVFLGNIFGVEKKGLMASTDILVLPSRYDACPIVLLEAMASGKPIIASKVGGISYLVNNGETGLLFEVGNIHQLARNVIDLLDNKNLRLQMGKAGKEKVSLFSWNNIVDQTIGTYTKALKDKH